MKYATCPGTPRAYHYHATGDNRFDFISLGRRGAIAKTVVFIPTLSSEVYHLSFGDITRDGKIDIHTTTNNGDVEDVLAIVRKVIENYTAKYPDRWIFFWGSTAERVRLFRILIGGQLEELSRSFHIYGEIDRQFVRFERDMPLKSFLIRRKTATAAEVPAVPRYYSKGGRVWVRGEVG